VVTPAPTVPTSVKSPVLPRRRWMRKLSSLLELSAKFSVISRSLVGRAVRLVGALGVLDEAVVKRHLAQD